MTVLTFLAADGIKNLLQGTVLYRFRQNYKAEKSCRQWHPHKRLPLIGWLIERQAGTPTNRVERGLNQRAVQTTRWFVNTKTFEDLVGMFLNHNSKFRQHWKARRVKRPRPSTGRVNIVS